MTMNSLDKRPVLDLLVERYPRYSRERLKTFIACRNVVVDGEACVDMKGRYRSDANISLIFPQYVSRGGFKLAHALAVWHLDPSGLVMLDAGSSTGGFTDCLLQHGAAIVHAVDVGYNQLDYRLRTDSRVVVHERRNIMTLKRLEPQPAAAVADLSFRSITRAASHILSLTTERWMVSLIKPQFELPKGQKDFFGVVHSPDLLLSVLLEVYRALDHEGVGIESITSSPILGRKGNREFLALLRPGKVLHEDDFTALIEDVVGMK